MESLSLSPELLSTVFHAAPVPVAVCSLSAGPFVEVNDAFLQLFEFTREEVVGRTDLELGIWVETDARLGWWRTIAEQRAVRDLECRMRTKSGGVRHALASAELITWENESYVLMTLYDATERLSQESQLRQVQKLEAVGRLAAGFAHDFNNILAIVQGYTSLVLAEPTLDRETRNALQQVSVAAERAASLTRQLLTFSRRQARQPKPLDLNELIQGLTNLLGRLLGGEILLRFNYSTGVPLVRADLGMMEQMIVNLTVNGGEAMPQGGQLTLSTSGAVIDDDYTRLRPEARVGQFACVSVSDTGRGMDPATLSRLFEPYFSTKGVGKGTGLGLATVYGIVKQHNGWIEVASQPGHGATFKIFLPAEPGAVAAPPAELAAPVVAGGKECVFVVEDEAGLRQIVQGILERYGYEVIAAANGIEALAIWQEHAAKIDLLLTDVVMPEGMTGQELAVKLKLRRPGLKVIYTSGYSVDLMGETVEALSEGVNFLQKPYRPQSLAQTVRNCLDGTSNSGKEPLEESLP